MNQGGKANEFGKRLESLVETTLQTHGYINLCNQVPEKQRLETLHYAIVPKRYGKQVYIGKGIYETDIKVDFYVVGLPTIPHRLIIECKWQQTKGSVDEKFPYLNLNILEHYLEKTIVIIAGTSAREGAIKWFENRVKDNPNLLAVYNSMDSFMVWANRNF
ncbi:MULTISPECIES: PD-(D/E)XK nuclease superfamily protein [Aerosakkonema]|uniref:PD-(D/E)XK nuclease superfamily protein n=1 Tax=Aerosakkonema TaxID=1246629 RepID=UPI0035B78F4B